jgi:hypothetical protein
MFLWQLIRRRLPLGEQLLKRHGPSNGLCALCGAWELGRLQPRFFTCPTARLMWAGVRDLLSCDWNPAGVGEFIALAQGLTNPLRRLTWFTFAALCWTRYRGTDDRQPGWRFLLNVYTYAVLEGSGQTEGQGLAGLGTGRRQETVCTDAVWAPMTALPRPWFFFKMGEISPQLLHPRDAHDFFIRLFTTP